MRTKEQVPKGNMFNSILILIFFLVSSNLLQFVLIRISPINYGTILDIISKYQLCEEENQIVNVQTWNNMNRVPEKLLAISYAQKEALKVFTISDAQAETYIRNNKRFWSKGKYNHNLFIAYLNKIAEISKTPIKEQDYLSYTKIHLAKLYFRQTTTMGMRGFNMGQVVSKAIDPRPQHATLIGRVVHLPKLKKIPNPIKKNEIKDFIAQQVKNKIRFYLDVENISGHMLIVQIGVTSTNVMDAINFFLKQEVFNKDELLSFMHQVAIESNNFSNLVDYTKVMNQWKKNKKKVTKDLRKNINISLYFNIEELKKVEENENNYYLFNSKNVVHKTFTILEGGYRRFITKEHNKEKKKNLTDEEKNNYVLPTMRLAREKEEITRQTYDNASKYNESIANNSHLNVKMGKKIRINNLLYKFEDNIKGKAIVVFDNTNYPKLVIVEEILVETEGEPISIGSQLTERFNQSFQYFIDKKMYEKLFFIYYKKVKEEHKA